MRLSVRLATAALTLSPLLAVALAGDEEKKKVDLLYRWDLLDGKTAVYDVATVNSGQRTIRAASDVEGTDNTGERSNVETLTYSMTASQRILMTFARGQGERGRVTISTERYSVSNTQSMGGGTETTTFDSSKPREAPIPKELKAFVADMRSPSYTLVVSRRGILEAVEGRPRSDLEGLKRTFLLVPDAPCPEGTSWPRLLRKPYPPYGTIVNKTAYKLQKLADRAQNPLGQAGEWTITGATSVELANPLESRELEVRVESVFPGTHRVVLDGRGLKLEEELAECFRVTAKQVEAVTTLAEEVRIKSKLVEVRDGEKK